MYLILTGFIQLYMCKKPFLRNELTFDKASYQVLKSSEMAMLNFHSGLI